MVNMDELYTGKPYGASTKSPSAILSKRNWRDSNPNNKPRKLNKALSLPPSTTICSYPIPEKNRIVDGEVVKGICGMKCKGLKALKRHYHIVHATILNPKTYGVQHGL